MRAKFVNEDQNFKRGVHPKEALGLGGINLGRIRYDMKKKVQQDWDFFLLTILDGKTISGHMNKIRDKGVEIEGEWGNYTIKVDEWDMEDINSPSIHIQTRDNDMYILPIEDKKIFIENEG
jgi:hypothetical protein